MKSSRDDGGACMVMACNMESGITAGTAIPHNSKYGGAHETGLLSIQSIHQETGG